MAPHIFPEGNDRSWTRGKYYAINRLMRYMWWANHSDEKVQQALVDSCMYGRGIMRVDVCPQRDWRDDA